VGVFSINEVQLFIGNFRTIELLKPKIEDYPGEPSKVMAGKHIKIEIQIPDLESADAKDLAKEKAKEICADPMFLSWF
jgi:hypothetical protein